LAVGVARGLGDLDLAALVQVASANAGINQAG